jgi:hypothetical protein
MSRHTTKYYEGIYQSRIWSETTPGCRSSSMADVEDPGGGVVVEAEPTECCRCMFICVMGFFLLALMTICTLLTADDFQPSSKAMDVAANVVVFLALVAAGWFGSVLMILVGEWYDGNPEGERVVDRLIQSERGVFKESVHQFLLRIRRN